MYARSGKLLSLLLALSAGAYDAKLPKTFEGYVTSVTSQNQFEMGSRRVIVNSKTGKQIVVEESSGSGVFKEPTIHVGSLLHVEGGFDKKTGEFIATSILYLPEPDWGGKANDKIEDVGLIEEKPALQREGNGVAGTLWVNGYPLKVTPRTKLLSEDGKDTSLDQIHTDMWAAFQGKWSADHSIEVLSIRFAPNLLSQDEANFRYVSDPEVQLPDYANHKPGKISWPYKGMLDWTVKWTLNILPDQAIQDYVTRVGESLIPQYQKDLSASDPSKIDFQFYVVEKPSGWKETLDDAIATPGGVVIVPDNVLSALDNEAQVATILSNCIATTLAKQAYAHHARANAQNIVGLASGIAGVYGLPIGVGNGIAANRLVLHMYERSSRIALRYMLNAGYDIREAPFAWRVAANKELKNPWPVKADPSDLTQDLIGDLYFVYACMDYSQLKKNREAYHKMLAELRSVAPRLPKSKNYPAD